MLLKSIYLELKVARQQPLSSHRLMLYETYTGPLARARIRWNEVTGGLDAVASSACGSSSNTMIKLAFAEFFEEYTALVHDDSVAVIGFQDTDDAKTCVSLISIVTSSRPRDLRLSGSRALFYWRKTVSFLHSYAVDSALRTEEQVAECLRDFDKTVESAVMVGECGGGTPRFSKCALIVD
jgi:hypothetical protein